MAKTLVPDAVHLDEVSAEGETVALVVTAAGIVVAFLVRHSLSASLPFLTVTR